MKMLLFDVKNSLIHRSMIPCLREFVAYAGFYSRFIFFHSKFHSKLLRKQMHWVTWLNTGFPWPSEVNFIVCETSCWNALYIVVCLRVHFRQFDKKVSTSSRPSAV